ncbi:MAG: hypothetical protein MUC68_06975 [Burkholderiaceae bacterium]|jgi:hypothetical protein|nr:hypothetical protein [Burkholderiaceae bacterium]
MATSKVQVCSNALLLLNDRTIADFNEDSDRARLASNLWDNARQFVLRAHPWNCAVRRVALAPETDAPAWDWARAFLLPGDCLRVLGVGARGEEPDYELEGRRILMNDAVCRLRYVADVEDVAAWDAGLVEAMTVYMAHKFAYPVTGSAQRGNDLLDTFSALLRTASGIDGQEQPMPEVGSSTFVNVRALPGAWR